MVKGRVYQQMPHKVINSNYCKRNHYVRKEEEKSITDLK